METTPKTKGPEEQPKSPRVEFASEVLQQIRQHARSSMRAEICGVLIGDAVGGVTRVTARIAGEGASQGGAHVTFTQDTWEHIYKVKDAEFPSQSIVGWYHSHPGFGIFLSDYDLFIHENFFTAPHQVAWVFDPHSDEEGCFGWTGKKVEPIVEVVVIRKHQPPAPEQTEEEAASRKGGTSKDPSLPKEDEKRAEAPSGFGHVVSTISIVLLTFIVTLVTSPFILHLIVELLRPGQPATAESMATPLASPSQIAGDPQARSAARVPQPSIVLTPQVLPPPSTPPVANPASPGPAPTAPEGATAPASPPPDKPAPEPASPVPTAEKPPEKPVEPKKPDQEEKP